MTLRRIRGRAPSVHPDAWVAPSALVTGDVRIDAGSVVLDGAILTAESAAVTIGAHAVVMEHAVVRGAGTHPTSIGARTVVGPGAHVTGAVIGEEVHGRNPRRRVQRRPGRRRSMIAIGAIVHVGTRLPESGRVPVQHIAAGDPAQVYPPQDAPAAHAEVERIGFTREVFGHDTSELDFRQTLAWLTTTYSAALRRGGSTIEVG
jgi:carbonic anhydrase/acetyltransferase-like protein (isoleucine patch superfamily)